MNIRRNAPIVLALALVMAGCSKQEESPPPAADATAASDAAAAAGTAGDAASTEGAAAPAAAANGTATDAAATVASDAATPAAATADGAAAPAAAPAAEPADPETLKKQRAIDFALAEEKIASDPQGQWASTAKASSTYNDAKDGADYSASRATGAPDVTRFGDDGKGWAPKEADAGIERLELGFAKPVQATGLRIRQNSGPGALIKVELIDDAGKAHVVHEGNDAAKYDEFDFWFTRTFPKTAYKVTGAKLTLATNAVSGWNEVDAVQLLGE